MKTLEQHISEHQASLERAEELFSKGVGEAKANYERLLAFYTKQKDDMIAAANKRLTEGKATVETHVAKKQLKVESKKQEKEEKAKKPKAKRRSKQEIEIDEAAALNKKMRDEAHRRHLEKKTAEPSSNKVPEVKVTSEDRNRLEVFGGVNSFLGFDSDDEEKNEEKVEEEDEWDVEGMSDFSIRQMVQARHRNGCEVPEHLQKYLDQKKKPRVVTFEEEDVIIPEEELCPKPPSNTILLPSSNTSLLPSSNTSLLPPPKPQTLSNQIERRKPVKQVKGVHSYSLPLDG